MAESKDREEGFTPSWRSAEFGSLDPARHAPGMAARRGAPRTGPRDPNGFTPSWRSAEHGFTLVELMVVIVIIGLAAAAVVLAMPEEGGSLRGEAERLAARTKAARDSAILEARPTAVTIGPGGYQVARRLDGAWRIEARYGWAGRTRPEASASIRFDSTGMAEPAAIVLLRGDVRATVAVGGDGGIRVE